MARRLAALEAGTAADWKSSVEQLAADNDHLRLCLGTAAPAAVPA